MKEVLKSVLTQIKNAIWIPNISKDELLDVLAYPILAAQLWCLNLVIYVSVIITGTVFAFLLGGQMVSLQMLSDFTRAYFYDGVFIFEAWRIHLLFYIFCLLLTFRD